MGPAAIGIVMAAKYVADKKKQRAESKRAQAAMTKQRRESLGVAGPESYLKNYDQYKKAFLASNMPWLKGQGETLATGESANLAAIDAEASRRGISGGVVDALRSATRSGRQSSYNQALTQYQLDAANSAKGEAGQTSSRQLSASLGAPYQYIPKGDSWAQIALGAAQQYASGYGGAQANLGSGQGWQSQLLGKTGGMST